MNKLKNGIYTALVTPYKSGGVDAELLVRLVGLNRKNGVDKFYVCGSSAEMTLLSLSERKYILETVLSAHPEQVIAHVGGQNMSDCLELARHAARVGANAVSAVTPYYYKYTLSEISGFYDRLADFSGLPVVIYSIPAYSGVTMNSSQLATLLSKDYAAALKLTSKDIDLIRRTKQLLPDKLIFNGCDEVMFDGLMSGADGAIGATFNVMCDKAVKLYSAFKSNDFDSCRKLQDEICGVISTTSRLGGLKSVKALLCMLGYEVGQLRAPFEPLSDDAINELRGEVIPRLSLKI